MTVEEAVEMARVASDAVAVTIEYSAGNNVDHWAAVITDQIGGPRNWSARRSCSVDMGRERDGAFGAHDTYYPTPQAAILAALQVRAWRIRKEHK